MITDNENKMQNSLLQVNLRKCDDLLSKHENPCHFYKKNMIIYLCKHHYYNKSEEQCSLTTHI